MHSEATIPPTPSADAPATRLGGAAVRSFGHGQPLLLLHGGVGSWTHWRRNVGALAPHFRVHAADLPGFGDAPDVPRGTTPEGFLDIVTASFAALASREGPLRIAGFSFGAALGATLARRLGTGCAAFAAVGPGGFGEAPGRKLDLRPVPPSGDPAYRAAIRHNLSVSMIADPGAIDDATVDLHCANLTRARFDSRRISLRATLLDDVARIAAPVMAIWGGADRLAWPSVADRITALLRARPDARIETIPGAGHWTQYERPAPINALLIDFFGQPPASSTANRELPE